ncbi:RmlC-like cupin domain-containing protein [Xylariaceae sp. FL1651]|nr:RmlC-like cupin domain-containing protein [Xylariaceae sp. FL1651]
MAKVSVPSTFDSFNETWSPRLIAAVNDQHVKIAKVDGPFIFHTHPDSDELFYLLAGELTLEIETTKTGLGQMMAVEDEEKVVERVVMKVGDVYVVPKGVKHRPVAKNAHIMMIERNDTVNTGDVEDEERKRVPLDVRKE